jgi:hypothetical protein
LRVVLAEPIPIYTIEDGTAVAPLVRAHLEPVDVPIFSAQVGSSTMETPEVFGTVFLMEDLVAMIPAFGSRHLHHFLIHFMMTMLGIMAAAVVFYNSSRV